MDARRLTLETASRTSAGAAGRPHLARRPEALSQRTDAGPCGTEFALARTMFDFACTVSIVKSIYQLVTYGWQRPLRAFVGFGLDSVVEVSSALVIAWRLTRGASETAERRAVRLIALSFFAIATYVTIDAALKLLGLDVHPEQSAVGLAITALSLVVMTALAWAKRRIATGLNSVALRADAAETQLCTYLSAIVLIGLAANALVGRWWMDPLAGLVVAALAISEGRAA